MVEVQDNKTKPLVCPGCRTTLGLTDGIRLFIAGVFFSREVTLTCRACKRVRVWRPVAAGQK